MLCRCRRGRRCNVNTRLIATCRSQASLPVYRRRQRQRPASERRASGVGVTRRAEATQITTRALAAAFLPDGARRGPISPPELQSPHGQEVSGLAAGRGKTRGRGLARHGWTGCSGPAPPALATGGRSCS